MANRERGERSVEIDGQMYTLVLDIDAMCALEELFSTPDKDVTFGDVMTKAETGSIKHLRAIWWACLQRYQPQITVAQASQMIMDIGGLAGLQAKLLEVSKASQPDARDLPEVAKQAKRPRGAQANGQAGTGAPSTSRPGSLT